MSERARILAWWGYVICVIVIFEVVFQLQGFAFAVGAALLSIVILGILLKLIVRRFPKRPPLPKDRSTDHPG